MAEENGMTVSDAAPRNRRAAAHVRTERREIAHAAALHPLEAELSRLQRVQQALDACPPQRWAARALWWGLRWFYQRRLQEVRAAWVARASHRAGAVAEAAYDFEPALAAIAPGEFLMGSDPRMDQYALGEEQPQHALELPGYYLAKTPVTNAQYAAFVDATGHEPPRHWEKGRPPKGQERHPVVRVSWYDAVAYCNWLAGVTGKPYRLPTEAEWEKGARGGGGRLYPWGEAWEPERGNTKESGREGTTPVGAFPRGANAYGLVDVAGNVWEWTSSLFWPYPYRADDGREDPDSSEPRVLRGGSWLDEHESARVACRRSYLPAYHSRIHGFRCCMSLVVPS